MSHLLLALSCGLAFALPSRPTPQAARVSAPMAQGMFTGSTDIGSAQRGASEYNAIDNAYRISGGGDDVWGTADAFRFTWTRLSGDGSLSANLHIDAPTTFHLAKGMLMFRQNLTPGSPYADIAMHADGHITLQYRLVANGETRDTILPENNVKTLRIVKRGDRFTVYASAGSGRQTARPPSITVLMPGSFYVGLGVCSHNVDALQSVTFTAVHLETATR